MRTRRPPDDDHSACTTFARDEVQRRNGLEIKDALIPIGEAVLTRIRAYAADTPFIVTNVVVGNV